MTKCIFYATLTIKGDIMNIYIIRHGESEANLKTYDEIKEDCLVKLTQKGLEDAQEAGKFLQNVIKKSEYNSSIIITSTYLRALQTTGEIKKYLNLKTTSDKRLVEFDRGLFIKCKYKERRLKFPKEYYEFQQMQHSPEKFFAKPPEGESGYDVYQRVNPFTFELRKLYKNGVKNVVIVTHHDTMKVLTMAIMGYDKDWFYREGAVQNCSIRKINLTDNKFHDEGFIYRGYYIHTKDKKDGLEK